MDFEVEQAAAYSNAFEEKGGYVWSSGDAVQAVRRTVDTHHNVLAENAMDPLTLTFSVVGLAIAGASTWYTYLAYKRAPRASDFVASTASAAVTNAQTLDAPETLLFLLLIDQFPVGLWGASLEESSDLWGHKGDPGSITISTDSAKAITYATNSRTAEPICRYRRYLLSRQSPRGAFGMRRTPGTFRFPEEEILEHTRHTAAALRFFLFYDGVGHDCVTQAVRYLLSDDARTHSGLWVDHGIKSDERADPITVAFVVGALEDVRRAPTDEITKVVKREVLDAAILNGLNYIFKTKLRTSDGFWHYKYDSKEDKARVLANLYQYSAAVLSNIGRPCTRLMAHLAEANHVLDLLLSVTTRYQGALPKSPASNIPDLDASATLVAAADALGRPHDLQRELYLNVLPFSRDSAVMEGSAANDWSAVLLLACNPWASKLRLSTASNERVHEAARNLLSKTNSDPAPAIPSLFGMPPDYVRRLLIRRRGSQPT